MRRDVKEEEEAEFSLVFANSTFMITTLCLAQFYYPSLLQESFKLGFIVYEEHDKHCILNSLFCFLPGMP